MASPVSAGEILELTKEIIKVHRKFRYASDEMDELGRKVRLVKVLMDNMQGKDNQLEHLRKSPNGRQLAKHLNEELAILKATLVRVEEIAEAWKAAQAPSKPHRRAVFVLWTMREVPELRAHLDLHMGDIQIIRQQASQAGANLSDQAVKKIIAELRKSGFITRQPHKPMAECKKAQDVLKHSDISVQDSATAGSAKEERLLELLKKEGLSDADAQAMLVLYRQEITKKPSLVVPDIPESESAGSSDTDERSARVGKILLVGGGNGAWAIVAHAYLELVRAWTANNDGSWLFDEVDSAGLKVGSIFRRGPGKLATDGQLERSGSPYTSEPLEALFEKESYFKTTDYPNEKEKILRRMRLQKRRGIRAKDFRVHDYILCFNEWTLKKLKELADLAQKEHPTKPNKAALTNIGRWDLSIKKQSPENIVKEARSNVQQFLRNTLTWTRPARAIASGSYRTLFFYIEEVAHQKALGRNRYAGLKKMQTETLCQIHMSGKADDLGWIVAVTGPKEKLEAAQKSIEKFVRK